MQVQLCCCKSMGIWAVHRRIFEVSPSPGIELQIYVGIYSANAASKIGLHQSLLLFHPNKLAASQWAPGFHRTWTGDQFSQQWLLKTCWHYDPWLIVSPTWDLPFCCTRKHQKCNLTKQTKEENSGQNCGRHESDHCVAPTTMRSMNSKTWGRIKCIMHEQILQKAASPLSLTRSSIVIWDSGPILPFIICEICFESQGLKSSWEQIYPRFLTHQTE